MLTAPSVEKYAGAVLLDDIRDLEHLDTAVHVSRKNPSCDVVLGTQRAKGCFCDHRCLHFLGSPSSGVLVLYVSYASHFRTPLLAFACIEC